MAREDAITYDSSGKVEGDTQGGPDDIDADAWKAFDDLRTTSAGTDNIPELWVFRQPTDKYGVVLSKARLAQMFTVPVDECTLDEMISRVRDDYMGSDTNWTIRAQVRRKNGTVLWSKLIDIYKKQGGPVPPPQSGHRSETSELMDNIRQMLSDQEERFNNRLQMLARSAAPAAPSAGPSDQLAFAKFMTEMSTQQMTGIAALIAALNPRSSGTSDIMAMIKGMGEIRNFAADLAPSSNSDGPVELLKAVSPLAALVKSIVDARAKETPALPNPNTTARPPPAPLPEPAKPPPAAPAPTEASEDEKKAAMKAQQITQLREQLGKLAQIAPNKPDAKQVVGLLMPEIPPEMDDMIIETLQSDAWFTQLCFIQPAIKPHEAWFTEIRNEILACFEPIPPGTQKP